MSDWFYLCKEALNNFRRAKTTNLISLVTITIALAFLGVFLTITFNLNNFVREMENDVEITAFLKDKADDQLLQEKLRKFPGVKESLYISKEEALTEFTTDKELQELIGLIGHNPLPASLQIKINRESLAAAQIERLAKQIEALPGIEEVRYGRQWLGQLQEILQTLKKISLALGLTLSVGVLLIIANTIRLTVFLNADKIVIMRLVGATDGFIQGPYLIQGLIQGLVAGGIAIGLLKLGFWLIFSAASKIIFLPWLLCSVIILIGIVLGGGASFVAVRKFLPVTFR